MPLPKNNVCIIVADGGRARFFVVRRSEEPRQRFHLAPLASVDNPDFRARGADAPHRTKTERVTNRQAGPMHPIVAQRARHELEVDRRFARQVAERAAELVAGWPTGTVVLIADPRMLGLLRDAVRGALTPSIQLKELAKDYAHLTASKLQGHLALCGVLPARRGGAR